jgi:hypothetical protein
LLDRREASAEARREGTSPFGEHVNLQKPWPAAIRAGTIDLGQFSLTGFPLDQVNEALHHAANDAMPFGVTVLQPTGRA